MYVLKFAGSSAWPGDYVALDFASAGYPYATNDVFHAKFWETEGEALAYAASFDGKNSYKTHTIAQRAYEVYVIVED